MDQLRDSFVEGIEVREGQDGGPAYLGGYAAVFNQEAIITDKDGVRWREKIDPTAFTDAIGRDDVIAAVNHDEKMVLGRSRTGSLTLTADNHGLRYSVKLPNTTLAKDTLENVRSGILSGSSFKFSVPKGGVQLVKESRRSVDDLPLLLVTKVRLRDVGPVTFPAYEGTSVSIRSGAPEEVSEFYTEREVEARSLLERAKAEDDAKPADVKAREAAREALGKAKAWRVA